VRFLARKGDRVELGVKRRYENPTPNFRGAASERLVGIAEENFWVEPGKNTTIPIAGIGNIEFAGEYIDHKPPFFFEAEEQIDPKPGELRIMGPVLLRGKEVVFNVSLGGSTGTDVAFYWPRAGRFLFSLRPFNGATEGRVSASQITFEAEGQTYTLLTGVPATSQERIWVKHEPNYKPSEHDPGADDEHSSYGAAPDAFERDSN